MPVSLLRKGVAVNYNSIMPAMIGQANQGGLLSNPFGVPVSASDLANVQRVSTLYSKVCYAFLVSSTL